MQTSLTREPIRTSIIAGIGAPNLFYSECIWDAKLSNAKTVVYIGGHVGHDLPEPSTTYIIIRYCLRTLLAMAMLQVFMQEVFLA